MIALPVLLPPLVGAVVGTFAPRGFAARMTTLNQEPGKLNLILDDLAFKTNPMHWMAALTALLASRRGPRWPLQAPGCPA